MTIYLWAGASFQDADAVYLQMQEMLGEQGAIVRVPDGDSLKTALAGISQAVVCFAVPPGEIALRIQSIRAVLPATAFIAVLSADDFSHTEFMQNDCVYLTPPYDRFQLINALTASIRQAELLATLTDGAQHDEIENLYNRRYFLKRLGEEVSLSRRHLSPLCCVILGINGYTFYVDSYGYEFVRALLHHIAGLVAELTRHEDIVARLGDDELGILLPRSTEKGAKVFITRLVEKLGQQSFSFGNYTEQISLCAGLAGYPAQDGVALDADAIVRYGRHALHQARFQEDESEDAPKVVLFSEIKPSF